MNNMKNKKNKKPEPWPILLTVKAVIINEDKKVLLLRRAKNEKTHAEYCDLPGGTMEKGESVLAALKREIEEETGIKDVEIGSVIKISEYPEGHEKFDELKALRFLVYCKSGENVKLNSEEHSGFEWLDIDKAIEKIETKNGFEKEKRDTLIAAKRYLEMKNSLEGWKRCLADFENYKKRQEESRKDLLRYSTESIVLQIIPVLDNFQSATTHIPKDQKEGAWVVGIMYIQKQLENVLRENGLEEIEVKIGDNFDTKFHEAVHTKECAACAKGKKFENKISEIVLKGYKIGERVIRPVRVVVK
ncbi:MAG: Protein GrpE [Candidatus Moranbacteria bacterium GW2011_GWE2_35_2-]|nr:MAG: Protein GrpE [Candidatus Moranbacteria bacterium GW2011_GWE2_35_2-]KKQ05821.1 MAG: Protein GrpE [Candidatus Moranbacteria bacterium GW2011_GWF1_36_4]KKQ22942.1 MAG: Protein GrpE [Candidatus Moranbacteria bacterium GW2011_GWF2_37_11]KKQ29300.1 MAG: Protein GrpE [Candidatus Moranbacteria bacterium GW2011_GWD1_37_17]KKQ30827.1 MAG: Protein GrpE [Candidatus Moranbacteria bacterium GW2011_GWE1_37_24]KKQ47970.1 MAG: Protein GrpE [Candidatus Moranbacteria bacterium GW2011_GWD2_37_9]HBO16977.